MFLQNPKLCKAMSILRVPNYLLWPMRSGYFLPTAWNLHTIDLFFNFFSKLLEEWSSFCLCSMSLREGILRAASKKEFCCRRRRRFKIHRVMMMMIACLNMAGNLKCEYIFSTYKSFIHHCRDICNAENLTVKTSKPMELWSRMAIWSE